MKCGPTQYIGYSESFFFVLSRTWDKERILSLCEESNLKPSDSALQCSTTEPQRLHGKKSHYEVKHVLYVDECNGSRYSPRFLKHQRTINKTAKEKQSLPSHHLFPTALHHTIFIHSHSCSHLPWNLHLPSEIFQTPSEVFGCLRKRSGPLQKP